MSKTSDPARTAALLTVAFGALCLALVPVLPWIAKWPEGWSLPATEWIGEVVSIFLQWIKPFARAVAAALDYPMRGATFVLVNTPWPATLGLVAALGFYLAGWRMVLGVVLGLGFVLASGYWAEGMTTLALVVVSVPLALVAGGIIGVLAHEIPSIRRALQTCLDIMQTVPTFAYLTPLLLLFGFGPVVGLIASAIYAAPPMARNVLLGLERVEPDIREAAIMAGTTRWQQLTLIELPAARRQIMVGINQTIMAALSMVIIAAVIGGFDDIGWAVLLTMRKADFGHSLISGLVIVIFAVLIDRLSAALADERPHRALLPSLILAAGGIALAFILPAQTVAMFDGIAAAMDDALSAFTGAHGTKLDAIRNGGMYYGLLPLRIGLDQAVLPMTFGFQWTTAWSLGWFVLAGLLAGGIALSGRVTLAAVVLIAAGVLETGIVDMPWPFVLFSAAALGWAAGGRQLALFAFAMLAGILAMGLWVPAMLSLYLAGAAVIACALVGGILGAVSAASPAVWRIMLPICDFLQTIPMFVFLIPVLMFFQIGEFSAFLAICAYAVVPMIRYTRQGLTETPEEMIEAAIASGATQGQIFREVRAPYAVPQILLGLNQTILYAYSMLVIAALIGTTDLGQQIYLALGQGDLGLGLASGAAMVMLALLADRLLQGFAVARKQVLGL